MSTRSMASRRRAGLQASYHGVPIVGMALVGEQADNLARAVDRGYALTVSVKRLSRLAQDLEKAIKRLLTEPSFSSNAARVSHIMRAHRLAPVEKAAGKSNLLSTLNVSEKWLYIH